jgi:SAM-dependent methyltransferase
MKHLESWCPTKAVERNGRWRATRDTQYLELSSRLVADLQIDCYQSLLEEYARGHLLDIGCGLVPFYGIYRENVDEVTTVDWAGSHHSGRHVDLFLDLSEPFSGIPDESADTVLMSDVLEHLPDPVLAWREVFRILRPEGAAIIGVPFLYGLHEEPYDFYRFTRYGLERHANQVGFASIKVFEYGGGLLALTVIAAKMTQKLPVVSTSIQFLGRLVSGLPGVAWVNTRLTARYPLGYAVVAVKGRE